MNKGKKDAWGYRFPKRGAARRSGNGMKTQTSLPECAGWDGDGEDGKGRPGIAGYRPGACASGRYTGGWCCGG